MKLSSDDSNHFPYHLSHHGGSWNARIVKRAKLSTGYEVYLFERDSQSPFNPLRFVVAVKSPIDSTAEWLAFDHLNRAVVYYLEMLACYA